MTNAEYRALLAFSRNCGVNSANADSPEKHNRAYHRRTCLLRKQAEAADLKLAKCQNTFTLITRDGLAKTFDNHDEAFDFVHKYKITRELFLKE